MVYKEQDLVKHGANLPKYLHHGENCAYNYGVLDWNHLKNWKPNGKLVITHTSTNNSNQKQTEQMLTSAIERDDFGRRLSFSINKMAKSFSFNSISDFRQLRSTYKSFKSRSIRKQKTHNLTEEKQKSCNVHAIIQLKTKNEIPIFKLVADNSNSSILVAAVEKLPSLNDDSSLTYTFHSINGNKNSKGQSFDYDIVGRMKISSSYHAEFIGLERNLFVVRESVLYGPDCVKTGELAAIIVKNTSKENYGGIGDSKSTVVIQPNGRHSLPKKGLPSSLLNRWKSGGVCDCGGWDIGCELRVLTDQNESMKSESLSISDRLDLKYQGRRNNKHDFSLVSLENGLYSLEYSASISLLQAFSICVAIVSSQKLTHLFQVNHLQDAKGFTKPVITRHQKVKSQTIGLDIMLPISPPKRL